MLMAVLIATAAVAIGTGLGLASGTSGRASGPLHTFAIVTSVAVVLGQLLPDALAMVGLPALLVFALGFGAPRLIEMFSDAGKEGEGGHDHGDGDGAGHSHAHGDGGPGPCSRAGLEISYIGFLLHRIGDGMGLGLYSSGAHAGHGHYDLVLAIAGHTVPVTALVTMAFKERHGARDAILRMVGVVAATGLGMALTGALSEATLASWEPWLAAAVAGLLMHVVTHGWERPQKPTSLSRVMDFAAIAVAISLVAFGGHSHAAEHGLPQLRTAMGEALIELGIETAPMLLFGLAIAALLQTQGARIPARFLRGGSDAGQAARGALMGAPLPVCACGILPIAHGLRQRGGSAAFVVAFLLSTPELGIETFFLTGRFLGWPFAFLRLGAALAVAMVAAWLLATALRRGGEGEGEESIVDTTGERPFEETSPGGGQLRQVLHHFDDLLYHIGAWTLVGLLAAAYVQAAVGDGALGGLSSSGLDIIVVSLLAVPSYVCASSATPLAAVLLAKGMSPGAVLAGLLLGPATNLATVAWLRKMFGGRATAWGLGGLLATTWAIALVVNATFTPHVPTELAVTAHEHGLISEASAVLLSLLVVRAVWRNGLRAWLGSLGETLGEGGHSHGAHSH